MRTAFSALSSSLRARSLSLSLSLSLSGPLVPCSRLFGRLPLPTQPLSLRLSLFSRPVSRCFSCFSLFSRLLSCTPALLPARAACGACTRRWSCGSSGTTAWSASLSGACARASTSTCGARTSATSARSASITQPCPRRARARARSPVAAHLARASDAVAGAMGGQGDGRRRGRHGQARVRVCARARRERRQLGSDLERLPHLSEGAAGTRAGTRAVSERGGSRG